MDFASVSSTFKNRDCLGQAAMWINGVVLHNMIFLHFIAILYGPRVAKVSSNINPLSCNCLLSSAKDVRGGMICWTSFLYRCINEKTICVLIL